MAILSEDSKLNDGLLIELFDPLERKGLRVTLKSLKNYLKPDKKPKVEKKAKGSKPKPDKK